MLKKLAVIFKFKNIHGFVCLCAFSAHLFRAKFFPPFATSQYFDLVFDSFSDQFQ